MDAVCHTHKVVGVWSHAILPTHKVVGCGVTLLHTLKVVVVCGVVCSTAPAVTPPIFFPGGEISLSNS